MRNRLLISWMLCLLVVSAGLLLWHHYGMERTLRLDSGSDNRMWAYDDRYHDGDSVAGIKRTPEGIVFRCTLRSGYRWPYCGFNIALGQGTAGIDLSRFDTISLGIQAAGPAAPPLRIYLRNYDPTYARANDPQTFKVNQLQYFPDHANEPLLLPLTAFQVAAWWVNAQSVPPQGAAPDLSNITRVEVGIGDNAALGSYTITVAWIAFHGKWLDMVEVLSIILALWALSTSVYLFNMFWRARRAVHLVHLQNKELEEVNTALKLERRELERIARHDELTGLYNRIGLRDRLYEMVSRVKRGEGALSAIFMDIDYFKDVNDRHGHIVGDEILTQFAEFVARTTRKTDSFCRWGGEEFILLCGDTNLESACNIAEELRTSLGEHRWPHGILMNCSFGVAEMHVGEGAGDFLQRADDALYQAKRDGRNRVVGYKTNDAPSERTA